MKIILGAIVLSLASVAGSARAQQVDLDTVVVTGSRVAYTDLLDTPAVSITKAGDYLLQDVMMRNDTRDAELRKREIHATILGMIGAAGGRYTLMHQDGFRVALDRENYRIELAPDGDRPDASRVELQVRVAIGGDAAKAEQIIADMRRFIRGADKVGRTEIETRGETALVMNRPERFRYELIDAIAKDSRQLLDAMQMDCDIQLDGLNRRVEWQRASAAELLLYIPYDMTIENCRRRGGS